MKAELGIRDLMLMYVGNLEKYQGIDLLLESFALAVRKTDRADLVIIGGTAADIKKYRTKSSHLGIQDKVHFLGPKPVEHLRQYLSEADILVSPRLKGNNTPMKLYSYLHSAKPVLATNLPTHTQVIDSRVALLGEPHIEAFSNAMLRLIEDNNLRAELGMAGKRLIEEKFTYSAFRERLDGLFDWLQIELRHRATRVSKISH
jgi:glycosyltransferase involved in cell wall biosynthesis